MAVADSLSNLAILIDRQSSGADRSAEALAARDAEALARAGAFRLRAVVVGTLAFQMYAPMLAVLMTVSLRLRLRQPPVVHWASAALCTPAISLMVGSAEVCILALYQRCRLGCAGSEITGLPTSDEGSGQPNRSRTCCRRTAKSGDWSIFRPAYVVMAECLRPKTRTCPLRVGLC